MANKIKISESQYQRLLQRLDETPFNKMVTDSMEINDILTITRKSGANRFQIVDKNDKGVYLKNIDKGSVDNIRYFINSHSLNGSVLEMKTVDKNADQNILDDVSQWETYTLPDVKNIVISRDRKPVDRVDKIDDGQTQQPEPQQQPDDNDDDSEDVINEFLINILRTTEKDKRIDLELKNGDDLHFCCTYRKDGSSVLIMLKLEVSRKNSLPILNNHNGFLLEITPDEYSLVSANSDIVSLNQDGTFNLKIKGLDEGQPVNEIVIPNITDYDVNNVCVGKADSDDNDYDNDEEPLTPLNFNDRETGDEAPEEQLTDAEADNMYRNIVNDPEMKKAFFAQPTFWQNFVAYLRDKKHPGSGIITALNTVSTYLNKKLDEKIGPGFSNRGIVEFNPEEDYRVKYSIDEEDFVYTFRRKETGTYKGKIREFLMTNDVKVISYFTGEKDNNGKQLILNMLVNNVTDEPDVKNCELVMSYYRDNPDIVSLGHYEDAKVRFYASNGYTPNQTE